VLIVSSIGVRHLRDGRGLLEANFAFSPY